MPPQRLLAFQERLLEIVPESQEIHYKRDRWARYFTGDPDFNEITERFPGVITRGNVKALSVEAIHDHTKVRKLFLASMIWGYGRVGMGPWRTSRMLTDPSAPQRLFQTAIAKVTVGQALNAYRQFRLNYCGPAFFTKFFYFIGLGAGLEPLPLILDRRVAKAFKKLTEDEELDFGDFVNCYETNGCIKNINRDPEGYIHYIEIMNQWAHEIGCRADAIEYFLFDPDPAFWDWHDDG